MPREPWRDDSEYVGLWRQARQQADQAAPRLVLADWLEEHGHRHEAWRERLHALTGEAPTDDPDTATLRAGTIPLYRGAWRRLLAAPPPDDLLVVFDRDVLAYQHLRQFQGRCGLDMRQGDWSSRTERASLCAIPKLELLACDLALAPWWDWAMDNLPDLTHFEATSPMIDADRLAGLARLHRLRSLVLRGNVAGNIAPLGTLPNLRHLTLGPFWYAPADLAALAPGLESLHADLGELGEAAVWPNLRSFGMPSSGLLDAAAVKTVALHTSLERLDVRCGRLTGPSIRFLAELPRLRELALRFRGAAVPPLKALGQAPALESLLVEGPISDTRLRELVRFSRLRVLTLSGLDAAGGDLEGLADLAALEEVRLEGNIEEVGALPSLARLPRLVKLDVQNLAMPAETARAVRQACPPWVECLLPERAG